MLNAARAQGRPMIVMAMMTAATTQAAAIHNPPKRIQRMFSTIETGGMRSLLGLAWRVGAGCRSYDDSADNQTQLPPGRDRGCALGRLARRVPQPSHHAGRKEIDAGDEQQPQPQQPAVRMQ